MCFLSEPRYIDYFNWVKEKELLKNLSILLNLLVLSSLLSSQAVASTEHTSLYCWKYQGEDRRTVNPGTKGLYVGRLDIYREEKKILWWNAGNSDGSPPKNHSYYRELVISGEGTRKEKDWIFAHPKSSPTQEILAINRKTGEGVRTTISHYSVTKGGFHHYSGVDWSGEKLRCEKEGSLF